MLQYDSATTYTPTPQTTTVPSTKLIYDKSSSSKAAGRWTKEEHQKFIEGLKLFGKNWKQVEEHVSTRNGAQIRSHAQKFFNRLEREFNCKFDDLNLQSERKKLEETLKKISESPNDPFKDDDVKDIKVSDKIPTELSVIPETPLKFDTLTQNSIMPSALSQCNSPKHDHFDYPSFTRRTRKMSEDILMTKTHSFFDIILSKIKTSNNRVTSPRLSDLVDLSSSSRSSFDATHNVIPNTMKPQLFVESHFMNSSFRPNPRKMSEDNVLIHLSQLRRPEDNNRFSGEELVSKKFKVN